jgi:hypothetical protein
MQAKAKPEHQVMILLMRHAFVSQGPPPSAWRRRELSLVK